ELAGKGFAVERTTAAQCGSDTLKSFDGVIIGSPMRFGKFNAPVRKFIQKNRESLSSKKVFYFITCLYIVKSSETSSLEVPLFIDPSFSVKTLSKKDMTIMDKTHIAAGYIEQLTRISPDVLPKEIAVFNGRLDFSKLGFLSRVFMRIITTVSSKEQEGDFLNPEAARSWAQDVAAYFKG
ncbi:MAG: flavodoxin, partial [bacterium]|nr:flavodoxin [bacterium]